MDAISIRDNFESGVSQGATHMVVMSDDFDHSYYVKYCHSAEEVKGIQRISHNNMQRVMEVYNLDGDMEKQLAKFRCFEY